MMKIKSIADHLELVDTIARWHWEEWGHLDPGGSLESWTEGLRKRTNRNRIPTTYVALDDGYLLGSVSLVEHDMSTHQELSPWIAGVYVKPEGRGQGVAASLVRHAVKQAATMGIKRLYLYTGTARGLYRKLGWSDVAEDYYEGEHAYIMTLATG